MLVFSRKTGKAIEEDEKTIAEYEHNVLQEITIPVLSVKCCRTMYGNQSFKWSLLSLSSLFRPGSMITFMDADG